MAVNPYDQYFAELEEEERRRLRGTLDGALATQPDRFAAQKRVARYLGYPTSVVEVLPNLEQQAKIQSIDEQTEGAPAARRAYTDADFARLAHDDSGNLTTFERTLRGLSAVGDYLTSMGTEGRTGLLPDISASVWRANAGLLGLARGAAETAAPLLDPLTGRVIPENPLRSMAGAFGRQARRNEEIATGIAPAPEGVIGGGVSSGVQSLFQNILTLPVTLANPAAGLTVMSSIEGGRSYQEARERGIAPIQALPFAASQGLIEYATEKIPVGRLLGDLNRNTGLMRTLVNQMAAEVPGEQVATLLQDLNSWAVLNPEKPFSAYLAERPSAAAQTFIATLVGTGGTTLVAKGMDRLAVSAQQRAERAALAEDNAIRLEQLDQLASASKVRQRDAESFESFVASAAAEGPVTHVYIDAQTLAQSANVEAIAAVSPSVAAQLPQAAASGGVVAIPIEEYASNIAGTELNQGLIDNLRTEPEGFSRTEAKEFMQSQAEELRAEVEQVISRQENQDAYRASIDTLRNQITGELNQIDRFKGDVNQAYATLMSNWFGVLGGKLGMAPADLYAAYRPTFQAEGVAGPGVLDQARPMSVTLEGRNVPVTISQFDAYRGDRLVMVNVAPFERQFQREENFYVGPQGEGGIEGRYERFADFQREASSIEAPQVAVNANGAVMFGNGRHRYAFMRDQGLPQIPMAMDQESLANAIRLGYVDAEGVFNQAGVAQQTEQDVSNSLSDQRISPRMPTAVKATEDPNGETRLQPDLATAKLDAAGFARNIGLMQGYINFRDLQGTPDEVAEQMIQRMVENLLWLHDHWAPENRTRSRMWYVGGNRISHRWATRFGISPQQVAAVIAATSPQKDWFQNVSLAERILEAVINNSEVAWDAEMSALVRSRDWGGKESKDLGYAPGAELARFEGKTLRDLYNPADPASSLLDMAVWIRAWDEAKNPQVARVITPEGGFADRFDSTKGGKPIALRWQSFATIAKTLEILQAQGPAQISAVIGLNHKVRSFYNNIIAPLFGDDVTIDTHAVAAALLRPLASSDLEVFHNFGSGKPPKKDKSGNIVEPGQPGTANSAITGLYGTYAIYAEAYRRAAAQAGVLPREMQSITWEAVRGLFKPEQKRSERIKASIQQVWDNVANGTVNAEDAREQISRLVGGIEDPAWIRSTPGADETATDSSYARELSGPGLPGGGAGSVVGGTGRDAAAGDQGPAVLAQGRGNRGSFNPSSRTITLLKAADLSTFLHESAHFFLEVQLDVAAKLGGKAELTDGERQVLADTETLLKWFGVQDLPTWYNLDFEEQREYHERFARGFEAYLFEGRPPAIELQGLFQRFRAWLLNVYRSLKALNVELSDDVRGVFDRMLASSDEIALAEQGRSMMAMFETPEQAGMTVEEFAAYQALGTQATADAMDELQGRALRDMQYLRNARGRELKRLQRQADELRREIRAQVRTEVMSEPVYRAWTFLTNELTVDDMTAEQRAQDAARRAASAWRAARKGAEAQARVDAENAVWEASSEYQVRHKTQSTRDKARRKVLRRDAASVNDDVAKALAAWDQEHPDPQREQAPRSNPNVVDETRDSLLAAIAKLGGINRAAAEAEWGVDRGRIDSGVFGKPVLRREGGLSIDGMAEALAQYGYLPTDENGKVDLNDLAERFDAASRGEAVFSQWVDPAAVLEFDRAAGRDIPNPTALSAGRLDRDALREIGIDDVIVRRLQDHKMVAAAGLHPDVVAEIVGGFSSGDELVRALAAATPPAEALEAAVDLRMLEQHGDISSPEALERAADKAVHNEMRARVLAAEANALAKAVGPTQQVGTDRRGRPVMRPILPAAAKAYAAAMIARMRIRDIRPGTYTAGEVRAAKAAAKAQQSGDLELAATEKRNQLIQLYAARAAHDALDESQAGVRYLRKFDSEGSRKGLTPDYLEQIDSLLERFDLRTGETLRDIDKRTALADWITSQREQGLEPDVPPALVNEAFRKSHKDMTLEELRGLVDTVKQIEHLGRLKKKLLTAKDQREFEVVRDEIAGSIALNADGRQANTRTPTTNLGQWAQQLRRFWASHIKAATWARIFDGAKDGGPAWTYFIAPANERASMETTMRAEATAKLSEILAPLFKLGRMSGSGQFFPSIGRSLNRQERIAIALNTGNEGNLQRLLGGEGWRLEQIQPVLQSLTTTEWQAVQAIWDYLETFRPAIGEKEMRVYGKEPAWVEPRGFTVVAANGQTVALRGGYYPIKYDPAASQRAEENYDAEEAKRQMQGAYTTATTKRSFTKARVEEVVGRPLLYNLSGLYSGVNDVIHDLAWHEWLIDVNRLLRSKKIDEAIRSHYGPDAKAQLKSWVADIAEGERGAANAGEAVLSRLRQGVSAAGLGFNVMSALMQPLGFTQSMVRIGPVHVARGIGQFLSDPLSSAKTVNEKSEFMRNRARTRFRELAEVRNRVQDQNQALAAVNAGAFFMMLRMQQLVDIPTWLGAYDKAIVANETEERAIALADQAVIDAQGGGQLKDLSAIERGGPALKLFTVFYSFMNTAFNLGVTEGMTQRSKGRLAANMLLLYTVPAVLGVALKDALQPGSGGDDEDWEQTARKLIAAQLEYLMGMMVVVREFQAAGKIVAGSEGVRDYQGPAGVRAVGDVIRLGQQAAQGDFDDAFRKAAVNVIGDFSGLPAAQINKTITGAQAMAEGETENPAALVFGFARQ